MSGGEGNAVRAVIEELRARNKRLGLELNKAQEQVSILQNQVKAGRGYIQYLKSRLNSYDKHWDEEPEQGATKPVESKPQ